MLVWKGGIHLVIPFAGFAIGAGINFGTMIKSGLGGMVLGLIVFIVGGGLSIIFDRLINRRPGYAGAALSSIAGATLTNPIAIAEIIPEYKPYVESATSQMAAAVILLVLIVPPFTGWIAKKFGCPKFDNERANAVVKEEQLQVSTALSK